jgi:chromosome segregation ATPase
MTLTEKNRRLTQALKESKNLLDKATIKYNNSITALKMEIAENKELGNDITANKAWIDYCNKDKERVKELKNHIAKLERLINSLPITETYADCFAEFA